MFRFFLFAGAVFLCAAVPSRAADIDAEKPPFYVGGDTSFLSRIEELGGRYFDRGKPADALQILRSRGANLIRLRLWVNPSGRDAFVSDLPRTLALAKRAKKLGFSLLLDLHYSDSWADPGQQPKPAAWENLDFPSLTAKVEQYSRDTLQAFKDADVLPDMVQIGNETPSGMLWPDGKTTEPGGWKRFADLARAGIRGVRAGAFPRKAPQTLLHINNGDDIKLQTWFFDHLQTEGGAVPFDIIGLSYYPEANSRMEKLKSSLATIAAKYHKPILIAEAGFPFDAPAAEAKSWEFAPSPQGQKQFLEALIQVAREIPDGLGRGVCWWEPTWIPVEGLGHYSGSKMLFDRQGNALPALDALKAN